jgi:hypothetical protein
MQKRLVAAQTLRSAAREWLRQWQQEQRLAGVREAAAFAKLPAEERTAFTQLWADAEATQKNAEEKPK